MYLFDESAQIPFALYVQSILLLHVVAWWRYDIEIFQQNWPFAGDYKKKKV